MIFCTLAIQFLLLSFFFRSKQLYLTRRGRWRTGNLSWHKCSCTSKSSCVIWTSFLH